MLVDDHKNTSDDWDTHLGEWKAKYVKQAFLLEKKIMIKMKMKKRENTKEFDGWN